MNKKIFLLIILFSVTASVIYSQVIPQKISNDEPVNLLSASIVEWFGFGSGMSTTVKAIAVNGNDVYVGGLFSSAGGTPANKIARWDGNNWFALGSGVNGTVNAIVIYGTEIYAAGSFTLAGGVPVNNIAKWNGSNWSAVGGGVNEMVLTLTVSGNDLYAGGFFTQAGGISANRIARWNGSNWSPLDSGINNEVNAIAVVGSDVYAGGFFSTAGRIPVNNIARWDGTTWSALGEGINGFVKSIIVKDNNLYVGGIFETAGGASANRIARWDGNSWSSLGAGVSGTVLSITSFGNDIYVGGMFLFAGGIPANRIAKYNIANSTWSPLGAGVSGSVDAMAVQTTTGSMVIGGAFGQAGTNLVVNYVARFTDSENPLPVELSSFHAKISDDNIKLIWETTSEKNNFGFNIEKTLTLTDQQWITIGFVGGQGTTGSSFTYTFVDETIYPGKQYYRLKQIDYDGTIKYSNTIEVDYSPLVSFELSQNYPNPFNPSTLINYSVPVTGSAQNHRVLVQLKVYDVLGNEIATLVNEEQPAGSYQIEFFSPGTGRAVSLPSGVYIYKLTAGNFVSSRKMIILK